MKKTLCTLGFLGLALNAATTQAGSSCQGGFPHSFHSIWDAFERDMRDYTVSSKEHTYIKDNKIFMEYEIPGFSKEDVTVSVEDGYILSIKAEKRTCKESRKDKNPAKGYVAKSFSRKITLPRDLEIDNIKAEVRNGILTVILPRKNKPKDSIKTIEVS